MSHRPTGRRPSSLLLALPAGALLALIPAPAAADDDGGDDHDEQTMVWHRLDIGSDPPAHERLHCVETESADDEHADGGEDAWRCSYETVPGPGLSDPPFEGTFVGAEVEDDHWPCPTWLGDVCGSVDDVVAGTETFFDPGDPTGEEFPVQVELLVLENGDLWVTWIESDFGTFSCPWYETFEEALESPADCLTP